MAYLNSINLNRETGFPYLVMDIYRGRSVPEPPGFRVFHWHEDFQLILCYEGEVYVHTLERTYLLKEGCGIFINKDVVHYVAGSSDHHYKSFLFPEHLVSFHQGSPAAAFVRQISVCENLPVLELSPTCGWQKEILDRLYLLAELECERSDYYIYEVLVRLSEIWLQLVKNLQLPVAAVSDAVTKRMTAMLRYIETHYGGDVTLEQIASSAGISKSEATRCFRQSMQETPYNYLLELRLSKAAALLSETDMSIGEICRMVGMGGSSHFGKLFRRSTGCTPKQYRNSKRAGG